MMMRTPQHKVDLPEYRIARVPVTVAQFARFVEATGYKTQAEKKGSGRVWTGTSWEEVSRRRLDTSVRSRQRCEPETGPPGDADFLA